MTLVDDLATTIRPHVHGPLPGRRLAAELLARQERRESNPRVYGRHLPIAAEAATRSKLCKTPRHAVLQWLKGAS